MRGFAVAAGGWDDPDDTAPLELHVVGDDAPTVPDVVDLHEQRRRRDAPPSVDDGVIVAW